MQLHTGVSIVDQFKFGFVGTIVGVLVSGERERIDVISECRMRWVEIDRRLLRLSALLEMFVPVLRACINTSAADDRACNNSMPTPVFDIK
jgi:hypothetical protein